MGAPVMCLAPDALGVLLGIAFLSGAAFSYALNVWAHWMFDSKPDAPKGGGE